MTADSVLQQFDACISELQEEVSLLERGSCDAATLDRLASYAIKPEFQESVGKLCTFPHVSEFIESTETVATPTPPQKSEPEQPVEKRGVGRPSRKRKSTAEPEQQLTPSSSSSTPKRGTLTDASSSSTTTVAASPRRSKRAKKD